MPFTDEEAQKLMGTEGVAGVSRNNQRLIYVVKDTPEVRTKIEAIIGQDYRLEETGALYAQT